MPGDAYAGRRSGQACRATPGWRGHGVLSQGRLGGPPDHASRGECAGRVARHRSSRWHGHSLAWWQVLPRPARARVTPLGRCLALIKICRWGSAPGLIQPLDRRDVAAGGLDARDRLLRTLDGRGHVMCVGMDDSLAIAGDRDMAFPENQIAAFEFLRVARVEFAAEPLLLHVAVARAAGAGGGERNLHEPRTIDPKTALAAP